MERYLRMCRARGDVKAGDAIAFTDAHAIRHVLNNLLDSAIKFTESGIIVVEVCAEGEDAAFKVVDTGVGMSAEFLPHLFTPFKQESEGLSRRFEGARLGMTVAKRLVDLVGARISVETQKGRGTSVHVTM